jgi:hypothetical protein
MGYNNGKNSPAAYAIKAMIDGKPYAKGFGGGWPGATSGGIYRDAVVIDGNLSTWLYHGSAIAQLDRSTGVWKANMCGWEDAKSTRERINAIPGARVWRNKGKTYGGIGRYNPEQRYTYNGPSGLWQDDNTIVVPHPTFVSYDAWRGHWVPLTVVCGASNTGGWDDSPCRPEKELQDFRSHLQKHGIRSTLCWSATSNVFCTKEWVQVHPKHLHKARELFAAYEEEHETEFLHDA